MKRSYLFLPLLLLMTFILSCDKDNFSPTDEQDDFNLENFLSDSYFSTYNSHYNPLPLLESRSSELMTQTVKDYFAKNPKEAKKVEAKYGMLIWDRSFYMDGELGHFIKIPLAKKNSKNVEAVLFATLNTNNKAFNFVIHDRKDIRKKAKKKSAKKNAKGYYLEITQEYLAQKLIYFDHVSFQVKDCSLAEFLPSETGLNSESLEERSCYYVQSYAGNDYTIVNGELIIYPVYDYYYICFGGSGGSGGNTEDTDNGNDDGGGNSSGQGEEPEDNHCGVDDYIDKYISDNRIMCLWNLLQYSDNPVFCDNISPFAGKTKMNMSVYSDGSDYFIGGQRGITDYFNGQVKIVINHDYFKNKCDVLILGNLIHESFHAAILNIQKNTHILGWTFDNYPRLKEYFDLYGKEWDHEYMAGPYLEELKSSLKLIAPGFTDFEYEAIFMTGFSNTKKWKDLPEWKQIQYKNAYNNIENSTTCKKTCFS
jgi:hypothetical protein